MKALLFALFFLTATYVHATTTAIDTAGVPKVYMYVETLPVPFGDVNKFLSETIQYPAQAIADSMEARVSVLFTIDSTGKIRDAHVKNPGFPLLDAEAIKVVEMMPDWKPGTQDGKPVNDYYSLPITFSLTGKRLPENSVKKETDPIEEERLRDSLANNRYPAFGSDAQKIIRANMKYPTDALEAGIKGTVQIAFLIEPDGTVSEMHVEKSVYPSLDAEAMRIAKKMRKMYWIAAMKDGKMIRHYIVIPFLFY